MIRASVVYSTLILNEVLFNSLTICISTHAFKTNFIYVREQTQGLRTQYNYI